MFHVPDIWIKYFIIYMIDIYGITQILVYSYDLYAISLYITYIYKHFSELLWNMEQIVISCLNNML